MLGCTESCSVSFLGMWTLMADLLPSYLHWRGQHLQGPAEANALGVMLPVPAGLRS